MLICSEAEILYKGKFREVYPNNISKVTHSYKFDKNVFYLHGRRPKNFDPVSFLVVSLYVMLWAETRSNQKNVYNWAFREFSFHGKFNLRQTLVFRCSQVRAGQKYKISMLVLSRQMVRKSLSLTCNKLSDSHIQQQTDQITLLYEQ